MVPSSSPTENLTGEDLALKQQMELYVERVQDPNIGLQKVALESLRQVIRAPTSSLTAVPKPLKFLSPHYGTLKEYYETMPDTYLKKYLADILSMLAMVVSAEGERESIKYRLMGSKGDIGSWGHEYVRHLVVEFIPEIKSRYLSAIEDLEELAEQIVAFLMKQNAEHEAVDFSIDYGFLELVETYLDSTNFKRTCLYITHIAKYSPQDEDFFMEFARLYYLKFAEYVCALRIALYLGSLTSARHVFKLCDNLLKRKQLCYIFARHGIGFQLDEDMVEDDDERAVLQYIINNNRLKEGYFTLARAAEFMEPVTPQYIYKADMLRAVFTVDANRENLADTFVNAFVNTGFGHDKLLTAASGSSSCGSFENWLFKHKEHGKISAAASLGMILLWDVDSGLARLGKYTHSNDNYVIAGALLGIGIANCSVNNYSDPLLREDYIRYKDPSIRIGAIMGLGIAYAGTRNDDAGNMLSRILRDRSAPTDVIVFAAISMGLIFVGSYSYYVEAVDDIIYAIESRESESWEPLNRLLPLGLGLLFLDTRLETTDLGANLNKMREYSDIILLSCAFAGSGHVHEVQTLLGCCAKHLRDGETHQGPAVLGIAMVAMGEELGGEMAIRSLKHMSQYCEKNIRRAVPLALALLCISNPKVDVINTLSSLSHDEDTEVAMAAVFSLGLIGAGTNNGRIAGMLRNLSSFYYLYPDLLFCVRIAQGLVHLGKGLLTLNPYHSDGFLLSRTALAGLITVLHVCLDMKNTVLGKYHYFLYFLVLAMKPKMLMTVDENLKPISVPVRVGQAVDVVGQAGKPKAITGLHTQSTPVILDAGKRAELATEKYIPLSPILDGFVILKENPDYREEG